MPANQYGIDIGDIITTKENVLASRLKRKKLEREGNVEEAGYQNRLARMRKDNPNMSEEELKSNALNPKQYEADREKTIKDNNRIALKNARTRIIKYANPDLPDDVIDSMAEAKMTNFDTFVKGANQISDVNQVNKAIQAIDAKGNTVHQIATIKDPQEQQAAWGKLKQDMLANTEDPEQYKKISTEMPDQYNGQYAATILGEGKAMREVLMAKRQSVLRGGSKVTTDYGEKLDFESEKEKMKTKEIKERAKYKNELTTGKDGGKKPTYSQVKTHLREVRKVVKDNLEWNTDLTDDQKSNITAKAVKIAQDNPNYTVEEAYNEALGKSTKKESKKTSLGKVPSGVKDGRYNVRGKKVEVINGEMYPL